MISFDRDQLLILAGVQLLLLIVIFFIFVFLLKKVKHKKKIAFLGVLIVNFILIPAFTGSHQQLITDEKMLAHFKEHRQEIETLTNYYLSHYEEEPFGNFRNASPELKALNQKASVDRMAYKYNAWHENPYSFEAAIQYRQDVKSRIIDTVHDRSRQDVYVHLSLNGANVFYKGKRAYKDFLYIPQVAKVENGKLLYPISDIHPERISFEVISESLDQVPDWLLPGDCTMKRIDDHWFLSLCLTS